MLPLPPLARPLASSATTAVTVGSDASLLPMARSPQLQPPRCARASRRWTIPPWRRGGAATAVSQTRVTVTHTDSQLRPRWRAVHERRSGSSEMGRTQQGRGRVSEMQPHAQQRRCSDDRVRCRTG